ncbi:MAG: hypothetical protein ABEJ83_04405 [Candidatus Nanohaloarchaea archaeon]
MPFLRLKLRDPYLKLLCYSKKRQLTSQLKLLNDLREEESYLLIILDACRYDILNEVANDYFDVEVRPVYGASRNTFDWGRQVWPEEYDVRYVSGAPPVNSEPREDRTDDDKRVLYEGYVPSEHLKNIRDAWHDVWEEDKGIPPEEITQIALEDIDVKPLVVHYYQPHLPFLGEKDPESVLSKDMVEGKNTIDLDIWEMAKKGKIEKAELTEMYESNLRRVLETAKTLVNLSDHDKVVITADHGEALGEYGVYGHPKHIDHPKVREVPWVEIR